jgi:hypothetical protein
MHQEDRRWKPVFLFVLLLFLFPATSSVVSWIECEALGPWQWLGVLALPLPAWFWFRQAAGRAARCLRCRASEYSPCHV